MSVSEAAVEVKKMEERCCFPPIWPRNFLLPTSYVNLHNKTHMADGSPWALAVYSDQSHYLTVNATDVSRSHRLK